LRIGRVMAKSLSLVAALVLVASPAATALAVGPRTRISPRQVAVRMAWAEPEFSSAKVKEVKKSSSGRACEVIIEASDDLISAYTKPGQFVQLRPSSDVKAGFFAIASAPRSTPDGTLEFLIKETESTEWLTGASPGAAAEMCAPMGKGFDLSAISAENPDASPCKNVAFCVAGTGVAPIRAIFESEEAMAAVKGSGRTAQLFYGAQDLDDLAFRERFECWEQSGVQIVPVLSRASDSFDGQKGYVQDALAKEGVLNTPSSSVIVLCGGKEMAESIKEFAASAGIPEDRILTNF